MNKIFFSTILLCCIIMTGAYAQQPKWCNPPVLFNPITQTVSSVQNFGGFYASNAAYDENGNLLFYISGNVYAANGTYITSLNASIYNEIAIVKVPNTCRDYYIINTPALPYGYPGIDYVRLNWNGSGWNAQPHVYLTNVTGFEYCNFAVSKQKADKTRDLFMCTGAKLGKYLISNTGISFSGSTTIGQSYIRSAEGELYESSTAKKYAMGEGSTIKVINMTNTGAYVSLASFSVPTSNTIYGLEFINANEILFSSDAGIGKLNLISSNITYLSNTSNCRNADIERAANTKFYTLNNSHNLVELDLTTMAAINTSVSYGAVRIAFGARKLLDQVDFEDYVQTEYKSDLVIKDEPLDIGIEPLPSGLNGAEGDIWNCQMPVSCQGDQNPQSTATNYMRVRVTNFGCRASDPAQLRMYWTRGRSGETWKEHWFDPSIEPNNVINGHPAGGEITVLQGTSTSNPITVPSIAAGQSAVFTKSWQVPNKLWYPINGSTDNGPNPMICYLARITSATDPITNEISPSPIDVNVVNNNNIATRNSFVIDFNALGPTVVRDGSFMINNPAFSTQPVTGIEVTGVGPFEMVDNIEYIYLELDEELYNIWQAHGSAGSGIVDLGENRVRITNFEHAELLNLDIAPGQQYTIVPIVKLIDGVTFNHETTLHKFVIRHLDPDGRSISPGVYYIKYGTVFSGEINTQLALQARQEQGIKVYPNPFRDMIETDCPEHFVGGKLNIYNGLGQLVLASPIRSKHQNIDGRTLPAGLYLFEFMHGDYRSTIKVSKK